MSHWTGWGQWLALITMTLDHVVRYLLPDNWDAGWLSASLGRIAFPLFSAMVAWHGLFNTRSPLRYARRILIIGLIAQLPYLTMPRDGFQLNICFTLAAGLAAGSVMRDMWMHQRAPGGPSMPAGLMVASLAMLLLSWWVLGSWVEYGHLGLAMIPLYMLAFSAVRESAREAVPASPSKSLPDAAVSIASALPVLVTAGLMNSSTMAKAFTVATSLAVVMLATGAGRQVPRVPVPMPRRLWLAWYPGHFAAIALLLHWPR
ncbi:TraX family protein [Halomonas sp. YLGW01]|uniref:TraX family protein n=1 Tax=Halomonas sp. YLGW01 TaxID=2773308 RepID=UPI0017839126|nr:TraX family protein [Halomonas sp. YLGW01]